jgi:quercetin dioxygenase-like cupin family protein
MAGQLIILAPTFADPPRVTNAPGQGVLPTISPHLAAVPVMYALDAQPLEQIMPLVQRQCVHGTQMTFAKWTMQAGAVVPVHHHVNEQISWFTVGAAEVYSQGKKYILRAGDVMIIPPNVPHEFRFTEDTIDIDIFSPARQDWIDGTATYYTTSRVSD